MSHATLKRNQAAGKVALTGQVDAAKRAAAQFLDQPETEEVRPRRRQRFSRFLPV